MKKKIRYATIPLDETAVKNYDMGIENSKNTIIWEISEREFDELWESNVFQIINRKCNLLIDDFESEIINNGNMKEALKCAEEIYNKEPSSALKNLIYYMKEALRYKTILGFDF